MAGRRETLNAVIPSSGTDSATVTVPNGKRLAGFYMPAAFTGSTITFKGAVAAGDTPQALYNEASQYSIGVGTNRFVAVDPNVFNGVSFLVLVSGSSEGAERTIKLVFSD